MVSSVSLLGRYVVRPCPLHVGAAFGMVGACISAAGAVQFIRDYFRIRVILQPREKRKVEKEKRKVATKTFFLLLFSSRGKRIKVILQRKKNENANALASTAWWISNFVFLFSFKFFSRAENVFRSKIFSVFFFLFPFPVFLASAKSL